MPAAVLGGLLRRSAGDLLSEAEQERDIPALQQAGVYDRVQPKLVLGDNILQASQFVSTGNAQVGIVSRSLAMAPAVLLIGFVALVAVLFGPERNGAKSWFVIGTFTVQPSEAVKVALTLWGAHVLALRDDFAHAESPRRIDLAPATWWCSKTSISM